MQGDQEAVLCFKDTHTDARKFFAGAEARIEYIPQGFFIRALRQASCFYLEIMLPNS